MKLKGLARQTNTQLIQELLGVHSYPAHKCCAHASSLEFELKIWRFMTDRRTRPMAIYTCCARGTPVWHASRLTLTRYPSGLHVGMRYQVLVELTPLSRYYLRCGWTISICGRPVVTFPIRQQCQTHYCL